VGRQNRHSQREQEQEQRMAWKGDRETRDKNTHNNKGVTAERERERERERDDDDDDDDADDGKTSHQTPTSTHCNLPASFSSRWRAYSRRRRSHSPPEAGQIHSSSSHRDEDVRPHCTAAMQRTRSAVPAFAGHTTWFLRRMHRRVSAGRNAPPTQSAQRRDCHPSCRRATLHCSVPPQSPSRTPSTNEKLHDDQKTTRNIHMHKCIHNNNNNNKSPILE
jgi:hypothetical protein